VVVIVLTAILLGVIAIVSSLTAPQAKAPTIAPTAVAPTVPATPGKVKATPVPTATVQPHTGSGTVKPTAKPAATATHSTTKDVAVAPPSTRGAYSLAVDSDPVQRSTRLDTRWHWISAGIAGSAAVVRPAMG
jgi:hypothetical protein